VARSPLLVELEVEIPGHQPRDLGRHAWLG
jgi:hypothetical protein